MTHPTFGYPVLCTQVKLKIVVPERIGLGSMKKQQHQGVKEGTTLLWLERINYPCLIIVNSKITHLTLTVQREIVIVIFFTFIIVGILSSK